MEDITPILKALANLHKEFDAQEEFHEPTDAELHFYESRRSSFTMTSAMYMPHVQSYKRIVKLVNSTDIVVDAGAGDFSLALMLTQKVAFVYAIEINPDLVSRALSIIGYHLPKNLAIICADYTTFPIPDAVSKIVLLCNNAIVPASWKGKQVLTDHHD